MKLHSMTFSEQQGYSLGVCVCVCACVRACVHACVRACVRACVHACVPNILGSEFPKISGDGLLQLVLPIAPVTRVALPRIIFPPTNKDPWPEARLQFIKLLLTLLAESLTPSLPQSKP